MRNITTTCELKKEGLTETFVVPSCQSQKWCDWLTNIRTILPVRMAIGILWIDISTSVNHPSLPRPFWTNLKLKDAYLLKKNFRIYFFTLNVKHLNWYFNLLSFHQFYETFCSNCALFCFSCFYKFNLGNIHLHQLNSIGIGICMTPRVENKTARCAHDRAYWLLLFVKTPSQ